MKLLPKTNTDGIHRLARSWGLGDWDVIVAADGSGSNYNSACGWAGVLVDKRYKGYGHRKRFHGGMNLGTVGLAELMPFVHAMEWYVDWRVRKPEHPCEGRVTRVALVSDCQYLVEQGNALASYEKTLASVKQHRAIWTCLLAYEPLGYVFQYHHIGRATCALNVLCDDVAGRARKAMTDDAMVAKLAASAINDVGPPVDKEGQFISEKECNPNDSSRGLRPAAFTSPRKARDLREPPT